MLADGLTKDQMDPADLLRAALARGEYQLADEAVILELKKQHRAVREQRKRRQAQIEAEAKAEKRGARK